MVLDPVAERATEGTEATTMTQSDQSTGASGTEILVRLFGALPTKLGLCGKQDAGLFCRLLEG